MFAYYFLLFLDNLFCAFVFGGSWGAGYGGFIAQFGLLFSGSRFNGGVFLCFGYGF